VIAKGTAAERHGDEDAEVTVVEVAREEGEPEKESDVGNHPTPNGWSGQQRAQTKPGSGRHSRRLKETEWKVVLAVHETQQ
jgi:hypothetical protein